MPRRHRGGDGDTRVQYRIQKRGYSPVFSSSLARKCQFRPAISVGKRRASTTPAPPWMKGSTPTSMAENIAQFPAGGIGSEARPAVSARKLAATLWEMSNVHSARGMKAEKMRAERTARSPLQPCLSGPSQSLRMDQTRANLFKPVLDDSPNSRCDDRLMEVETQSRGRILAACMAGAKTRLKDVKDGIAASRELLKLLRRVRRVEGEHYSTIPVLSALRFQLARAGAQVDQLIQEHRGGQNEIRGLMKQLVRERESRKTRERGRIRAAVSSVAAELEAEKRQRRRAERQSKKLGRELGETKEALSEALVEIECQRRAREVLEGVYDGLAWRVEEEEGPVPTRGRRQGLVEDGEEPRPDEQRSEDKNAAVERLRNELEACLGTHAREESSGFHGFGRSEEEGGDEGSDLHSIELNVDSRNQSFRWSYAQGDNRRVPVGAVSSGSCGGAPGRLRDDAASHAQGWDGATWHRRRNRPRWNPELAVGPTTAAEGPGRRVDSPGRWLIAPSAELCWGGSVRTRRLDPTD